MPTTLPPPGPVAVRAADDALANVGVHEEGGENLGKAVETYQASTVPPTPPGSPWCACFVTFRERTAAHELDITLPADFCRSGYVPDWQNWAKARGLWAPVSAVRAGAFVPQKGDLCLFYFAAKGRVAHIGIVAEPYADGVFYSVEGNTSAPDGVDRDGDGVFKKRRALSVLGTLGGFIRMTA